MGVQFSWDNPEQSTVRFDLDAQWTWDELRQVMQKSWHEVSEKPYIVDTIFVNARPTLPANAIPHARFMMLNRPKNTGVLALVGANAFTHSMIDTLSKLYKALIRRDTTILYADSLDEARQLLAQKKAERLTRVR